MLAWPGLVIITPAPANHSAPQLRARPARQGRQARAGDKSRARASLSFSLQGRAGRGGRATDPPDGSVLDHSELGVCSQVSVCVDIEHQKLQTVSGAGRGDLVTPGLEIPSLVTLEAAEWSVPPAPAGWAGAGTGRYQHSAPAQLSRKIQIPTKITIRATFALIRTVTGCTEHSRKCVTG